MKLSSTARFHSSIVVSRNPLAGGPPELVTQISIPPNFSATVFTNPTTSSWSLTSNGSASTWALYFWRIASDADSRTDLFREHMATRQPSAAKASAVAWPSPWLDAATIATRFLSPVSMLAGDYRTSKIRLSRTLLLAPRTGTLEEVVIPQREPHGSCSLYLD